MSVDLLAGEGLQFRIGALLGPGISEPQTDRRSARVKRFRGYDIDRSATDAAWPGMIGESGRSDEGYPNKSSSWKHGRVYAEAGRRPQWAESRRLGCRDPAIL
jgi:hypothetical protein